jgi:hypothetical protein
MNWAKLFEIAVSDVLVAILISGIFAVISNKHSDKNEQEQEKFLKQMKEHIDLRLDIVESHLEKFILEQEKPPTLRKE